VSFESTVRSELYVEGETDTYFHHLLFRGLVDAALPPAESQALIQQIAERYRD
jgi:hypothetical protein